MMKTNALKKQNEEFQDNFQKVSIFVLFFLILQLILDLWARYLYFKLYPSYLFYLYWKQEKEAMLNRIKDAELLKVSLIM